MSYETCEGGFEFRCDYCNRTPEFYRGNWQAAWRLARFDGWRATRELPLGPSDKPAWVHRCPECVKGDQGDLVPCC